MYQGSQTATAANIPYGQALQCLVLSSDQGVIKRDFFPKGLALFLQDDNSVRNEGDMYPRYFSYFNFQSSFFKFKDGSLQARMGDTPIDMKFRVMPSGDLIGTQELCSQGQCLQSQSGALCSKTGTSTSSQLADGSRDQTFGIGGVETSNQPFTSETGSEPSIVVQQDGKALLFDNEDLGSGIQSTTVIKILRLDQNTQLDPSFGQNGQITLSYGQQSDLSYKTAQVLSNGKILLLFYSNDLKNSATNTPSSVLAMLNSNGSIDDSFGKHGFVEIKKYEVPQGKPAGDLPYSFAIKPDGRIVVSSTQGLRQYLPNGKFDLTFGSNGLITLSGTLSGYGNSQVIALENGDILVQNFTDIPGAVQPGAIQFQRFTAAGSPDTSYGNAGKIEINVPRAYELGLASIARKPNGDYVLVFHDSGAAGYSDVILGLLDKDGNVVPTFGQNGLASTFKNSSDNSGWGGGYSTALILADGSILVTRQWSEKGIVLLKFRSNGSSDPSFGNGGAVVTLPSDNTYGLVSTIDSSGRLKVWGVRDNNVIAVRYAD